MEILLSLIDRFDDISDPRVEGRTFYNLSEVMVITCVAVLCGQESWYGISDFARIRKNWFKKYLKLKNGIPSHDTFGRIFSIVNPQELENIFMAWINEVREEKGHKTICIDGKTVKGTVKTKLGRKRDSLHLVNAYNVEDELVIGQIKSTGAGNVEVTAAKKLLNFFNLKETLVLADAGVGRTTFAREVKAKGGHYLFPVKGNTKQVYDNLKEYFLKGEDPEIEMKEKNRGRIETRRSWVEHDKKVINKVNRNRRTNELSFPGVKTIGKIEYSFESKENRPYIQKNLQKKKLQSEYRVPKNERRTKTFTKYFISDVKLSAQELIDKSRLEWHIENKLHWVLDVSFKEDAWRTRDKIAAHNLSTIRKLCFNLAKIEKTSDLSMKNKLKKACYDEDYIELLLFGVK